MQSQVEAPRPAAVPARPNFAMGSQNPADQLQQDMQNAMHNHGAASTTAIAPSGGLSMHPGAGTGGVQILSDTQGVDFSSWLARWHYITQLTWDPLIPDEVNPPILKSGVVAIASKFCPTARSIDMQLDGRSGDTALDRAAWGAITGSSYPASAPRFPRPLSRAARLLPLQHGAALAESLRDEPAIAACARLRQRHLLRPARSSGTASPGRDRAACASDRGKIPSCSSSASYTGVCRQWRASAKALMLAIISGSTSP